MDDKDKRVAVAAGTIMNSSDCGNGCPVCGYEAFGPEWTKVLTLAEEIVKAIDAVGHEYWRQESVNYRNETLRKALGKVGAS